jgi:hypothetical protein
MALKHVDSTMHRTIQPCVETNKRSPASRFDADSKLLSFTDFQSSLTHAPYLEFIVIAKCGGEVCHGPSDLDRLWIPQPAWIAVIGLVRMAVDSTTVCSHTDDSFLTPTLRLPLHTAWDCSDWLRVKAADD